MASHIVTELSICWGQNFDCHCLFISSHTVSQLSVSHCWPFKCWI